MVKLAAMEIEMGRVVKDHDEEVQARQDLARWFADHPAPRDDAALANWVGMDLRSAINRAYGNFQGRQDQRDADAQKSADRARLR